MLISTLPAPPADGEACQRWQSTGCDNGRRPLLCAVRPTFRSNRQNRSPSHPPQTVRTAYSLLQLPFPPTHHHTHTFGTAPKFGSSLPHTHLRSHTQPRGSAVIGVQNYTSAPPPPPKATPSALAIDQG